MPQHQLVGHWKKPADPLWYWMTERMAIWQARNRGEFKPWTRDPILQQYRFCNVYRELDKVTMWIAENIRTPFADHPDLWFMLAVARTINHPPTLEELIDGAWPSQSDFEPAKMTALLDARKARREQVYTGAYMIRAESDRTKSWYSWTKQRYVSEIVLGKLWDDRLTLSHILERTDTLERAWRLLAKDYRYVGWGPFMSYEWVTDLRWTRYLRDAKDKNTWANAGPGALRGLLRMRTKDWSLPKGSINAKEATEEMKKLLAQARKELPSEFGSLELRDIEHSLCEMDKYLRVYRGEGKPRAKYDGK